MVLKCEIGTGGRKPQVEEYGLDELAASAESVLAGLGPLVAGLARLAGEAGGAVTLDAMEVLVIEQGRELLRGVLQLSLDGQAGREIPLARVAGADGVARCLELLQNDLAMVMTLAGRSSIADLDRSLEWPSYRV